MLPFYAQSSYDSSEGLQYTAFAYVFDNMNYALIIALDVTPLVPRADGD